MIQFDEQHFADYVGAVKLWDQLLDISMLDAQGCPPGGQHGGACRRAIDDARRWFRDDRRDVGSFLYVCDVLDRDPGAVREAAFNPEKAIKATKAHTLKSLVSNFRMKHGLTQRQMGGKVGITGCTIGNIEKGRFPEDCLSKNIAYKLRAYIAWAEGVTT